MARCSRPRTPVRQRTRRNARSCSHGCAGTGNRLTSGVQERNRLDKGISPVVGQSTRRHIAWLDQAIARLDQEYQADPRGPAAPGRSRAGRSAGRNASPSGGWQPTGGGSAASVAEVRYPGTRLAARLQVPGHGDGQTPVDHADDQGHQFLPELAAQGIRLWHLSASARNRMTFSAPWVAQAPERASLHLHRNQHIAGHCGHRLPTGQRVDGIVQFGRSGTWHTSKNRINPHPAGLQQASAVAGLDNGATPRSPHGREPGFSASRFQRLAKPPCLHSASTATGLHVGKGYCRFWQSAYESQRPFSCVLWIPYSGVRQPNPGCSDIPSDPIGGAHGWPRPWVAVPTTIVPSIPCRIRT